MASWMKAADPSAPLNHSPSTSTITGLFEVVPRVNVFDIPGMLLKFGDAVQTVSTASIPSALPTGRPDTVFETADGPRPLSAALTRPTHTSAAATGTSRARTRTRRPAVRRRTAWVN